MDLSSVPIRVRFKERAFSLKDLVPEYAKLDGMVFFHIRARKCMEAGGRLKLRPAESASRVFQWWGHRSESNKGHNWEDD